MTREDIIALAKTQLGVTEEPPGSNNVKYNSAFYGHPVNGAEYMWCVVFIWWLFRELGATNLFCGGNLTASCDYVRNWAKQNNQWVTDNYQPGDLVLFDWNTDGYLDHIGLVIEVNGNALTTIEGNVSERVGQCTRSGITMVGAYRPRYTQKTDTKPEERPDTKPDKTADSYTVVAGDTLSWIAARFGTTVSALADANHISDPNKIWVGQTLVIPGKGSHRTIQITVTADTLELLTIMADGRHKSIGEVVDALVEDSI